MNPETDISQQKVVLNTVPPEGTVAEIDEYAFFGDETLLPEQITTAELYGFLGISRITFYRHNRFGVQGR